MSPFSLIQHILRHPLNKDHKTAALSRFVKWQLNVFLNPYASIYPFTSRSKLIVAKGMTGATQNIYCGLSDYEDMFFLLHFLRPDDLFADIGANIGSYTVLAGAHAGAKVLSFEPVPNTYQRLLDNIRVNRMEDKVTAYNIGLGSGKGNLNFTNTLDTVNHVAEASDTNVITVPVETLDDVVKDDAPSLIKIDVEGFETEVLKGASQTLSNQTLKAIIIELNGSGNRYGYKEEEIHASLLAYGFQPYTYEPKERKLIVLPTYGSANTIYLRDEPFVANRLQKAEKVSVLSETI